MDTQSKMTIDTILNTVAGQQASDLHLSVGNPPVIRLNEQLVPLENETIITKRFMEDFVEAILTPDQREKLEEKKEIVISYQFNKQARFRVNIFYQKEVLAAYLRYVSNTIRPLDQLGLPFYSMEKLTKKDEGLIIISGEFGSGKTTTSASIIDYINKHRSAYILSIEEPIEYIFTNKKSIIEQREVGRDAISFEQGLHSVTQEDIDVLFISDLPSPEVIKEVLTIANSSRLVVATVEADSILKTLEYIINSFPGDEQHQVRQQLASNLEGVICQKLISRIGGGKAAIAEIMLATDPIRSIIKEGSLYQINNIIQTSREEGMASFDWSLADLVKTNQVQYETAVDHAADKQRLATLLRV